MDWIAPEILASLGLVLVAFLLGNCPCCGDPCIYFQDDYSVDNLATDYDNRSGSWAVSLDLLITTSTDALIVANTEVPTGVSAVFAETQMSFTATTATGRLVIAYVDDDNYWFAEVQAGATDGTLKLYERSGGTNTQRGSTTTIAGLQINETVTVQLCYADGELRASASVAFIDYTATITVAETQCGLGTGAGAGTRSFLGFSFGPHQTDNSTCRRCAAGCGCTGTVCGCADAPIEATVTLGGFSNGSCANCTSLNATFIISGEWTSSAPSCISPNLNTGICSKNLTVRKIDFDTVRVAFSVTETIWEGSLTADCTSVVAATVAFVVDSNPTVCTYDGTTLPIITLT
jgi:hypothetical protein